MSFHPRMYAKVSGVRLTAPLSSAVCEDMVTDCWTVETTSEATGNYVSMHPRLTIVLDGAHLNLATAKDQQRIPASLVYVPGGTQLWANFYHPKPFRHLDIHLKTKALSRLLKPRASPRDPLLEMAAPMVLSKATELANRSATDPETVARTGATELLQAVLLDPRHHEPPTHSESPIERVKAYIECHLATSLRIEELASVGNMSRTQFNRQFKSETGVSTRQWIIGRRVERAKGLIAGGHRLTDIAALAGFSDQAHLNRTFKSVTGLPPGRWAEKSI